MSLMIGLWARSPKKFETVVFRDPSHVDSEDVLDLSLEFMEPGLGFDMLGLLLSESAQQNDCARQ